MWANRHRDIPGKGISALLLNGQPSSALHSQMSPTAQSASHGRTRRPLNKHLVAHTANDRFRHFFSHRGLRTSAVGLCVYTPMACHLSLIPHPATSKNPNAWTSGMVSASSRTMEYDDGSSSWVSGRAAHANERDGPSTGERATRDLNPPVGVNRPSVCRSARSWSAESLMAAPRVEPALPSQPMI